MKTQQYSSALSYVGHIHLDFKKLTSTITSKFIVINHSRRTWYVFRVQYSLSTLSSLVRVKSTLCTPGLMSHVLTPTSSHSERTMNLSLILKQNKKKMLQKNLWIELRGMWQGAKPVTPSIVRQLMLTGPPCECSSVVGPDGVGQQFCFPPDSVRSCFLQSGKMSWDALCWVTQCKSKHSSRCR